MGLLEFKVPMHSEKCERKVRRALTLLPGIDTLDIDLQQQKVTISGCVDPKRALKRLRRLKKTGKYVEFWPQQQSNPSIAVYGEYSSSDSYAAYDYDYGYEQRYRPAQDDKVTNMFNESNPNACSIM